MDINCIVDVGWFWWFGHQTATIVVGPILIADHDSATCLEIFVFWKLINWFDCILLLPFLLQKQCKNCSGVFCESCLTNELPLPSSILPENVCDTCYFLLLQQYASSPSWSAQLKDHTWCAQQGTCLYVWIGKFSKTFNQRHWLLFLFIVEFIATAKMHFSWVYKLIKTLRGLLWLRGHL